MQGPEDDVKADLLEGEVNSEVASWKPPFEDEKSPLAVRVSSTSYIFVTIFIYLLIIVDIFLNTLTVDNGFPSSDLGNGSLEGFWPFFSLIVQTFVQMFICLSILLILSSTYLIQIGLLGIVLADLRYLGIAQVVYYALTLTLGILRIGNVDVELGIGSGVHTSDTVYLWSIPGLTAVFVLQNLASLVYYQQIVYATLRLLDRKYYVLP